MVVAILDARVKCLEGLVGAVKIDEDEGIERGAYEGLAGLRGLGKVE
jgi:hypothetical protein